MYKTTEKILLEFDPELRNLLPALKEISAGFGYVSQIDAQKIADYFSTALSQVYETASFYDEIKIKKQPGLVIQVCSGPNCAINNSLKIVSEIENYFRIKAGDESHAYRQAGNPKVKLEVVSCFNQCGEGPIVVVNDKIYKQVTVSGVHKILEEWT
jgi:NADH-quinone oxidoreductase subunit E